MSSAWVASNVSVIKVSRELNNFYDDYMTNTLQAPLSINEHSQDVMSSEKSEHKEAYYLYFIASVGILLNCIVVMFMFIRKPLRKMTSGFLIHACFLDLLKSAYCIPIASNLLTQVKPTDCDFFGASFVIIVTISTFNMVAMVCSEAYTFGEANVGGNSKGTLLCVLFGIALVYIGSTTLHLGPTLIGGYFEFNPDIGSCSFVLGKQQGYVANVMWIVISTLAMLANVHFIRKLYREIQKNQPNRVSFLVRTSITVMDNATRSACKLRNIIKDATHRAKMFILNTILFVSCWFPLFLLILIDTNFRVSPKVYQTFSFIAWSHGAIQPLMYICFDRNLNILTKYFYCDKYRYNTDTLAQLMQRRLPPDQSETEPRYTSGTTERDLMMAPQTGYQNPLETARRQIAVDIIREHQEMYIEQNSSNHNTDNSDSSNEYQDNSTNQRPDNSVFQTYEEMNELQLESTA